MNNLPVFANERQKNLRNHVAWLLFKVGLTVPTRHARSLLSIATFHRVLPEAERQNYPFPGLVVTPKELNALLTYFAEHYDCGSLAIQHKRYLSGALPPRPLLAITFDDAQYDNYKYARPLLAQHRVKASFFAPVEAVERQELLWHDRLGFALLTLLNQGESGKNRLAEILANSGIFVKTNTPNLISSVVSSSKVISLQSRLSLIKELVTASGDTQPPAFARLMTFEELLELANEGHEIGSHSMTHCMMPECDDQALIFELEESRRILQTRIGQPIETFCYPNGNSDSRTALAVVKAGYVRAVTTNWGRNGKNTDPFQLHRCDMNMKNLQNSKGEFLPELLAFRMSRFFSGLR